MAGQFGLTLPYALNNVHGIQQNEGVDLTSLRLKASLIGGVKAGYFLPRELNWLGVETEAYYTSPHMKQQDVSFSGGGFSPGTVINQGGARLRVTTVAFNLVARYPGQQLQPYVGVGLGIFWARLSGNDNGPGTASDTKPGLNAIAGVRWMVKPNIALYAEYKYNQATFDFGGGADPTHSPFLRATYSANLFVLGASYHFDSAFKKTTDDGHPFFTFQRSAPTVEEALETPDTKLEKALKELPAKGGYSYFPLPAYSYNRNEGSWIGALMPITKANQKDEITDIYAPMYLHNRYVGETVTMNYYGYSGPYVQYRVIASYATKIERNFDLGYRNLAAADGKFIVGVDGNWFKNAFGRFYGLGNNASEQHETNYTSREGVAKLTLGLNLRPGMSVLLTERYHDVRVEKGAVTSLPQTKEDFPTTPGIEGAQILGHGLTFLYDTRDNVTTPREGTYVSLLGEFNQNIKSRDPNRWWRFTMDARHLIPHAADRMVFVARVLVDGVVGQDENKTVEEFVDSNDGTDPVVVSHVVRKGVPFYERPTLGGESTLRAFGRSRFISNGAYVLNVEERIRVMSPKVFGYKIDLEVAPFLDTGRVVRSFTFDRSMFVHLQVNPGVGIRVVSQPNVVGRLDFAYGRDGSNVYVGLGYPF